MVELEKKKKKGITFKWVLSAVSLTIFFGLLIIFGIDMYTNYYEVKPKPLNIETLERYHYPELNTYIWKELAEYRYIGTTDEALDNEIRMVEIIKKELEDFIVWDKKAYISESYSSVDIVKFGYRNKKKWYFIFHYFYDKTSWGEWKRRSYNFYFDVNDVYIYYYESFDEFKETINGKCPPNAIKKLPYYE